MSKQNRIRELVTQQTMINESKYYLSLTQLFHLFDKILEINELSSNKFVVYTHYRSVFPNLYQEEFDFGGFYVECRDNVSLSEQEHFWIENKFWGEPDSEYRILENYVSDNDLKRSHFLCQKDDLEGFHRAIDSYKLYLLESGIPKMLKWLTDLCDLKETHLPYGYFCFEVYCD